MRITGRLFSFNFTFAVLYTLLAGCEDTNGQDSGKGLKDYYKDYFPIGVAVSPASLTGTQSELILSQKKSIGKLLNGKILKSS